MLHYIVIILVMNYTHTHNNSNGNIGKEYFFFLQRLSVSNLLHFFNLNIDGKSSGADFKPPRLPIYMDVDANEKDEGEDTVNHQVKIDEIDLNV